MAAAPLHSCSGLPGLHFFLALLAFWWTFVDSGSAVTVIQTPSFVNGSIGKNISFSCSVDETGYKVFLYHQLPGKSELEVLGYLSSFGSELQDSTKKDRLKAKWKDDKNNKMHLDLLSLQASDTGFYLCAAVYTMNEVSNSDC
ncbi:V-set and immunoglobulin domain-containing protein 2-like [Crotalus adamanteus]